MGDVGELTVKNIYEHIDVHNSKEPWIAGCIPKFHFQQKLFHSSAGENFLGVAVLALIMLNSIILK